MNLFKQAVLDMDHAAYCGGRCGNITRVMFLCGSFYEISAKSCQVNMYSSEHEFFRELISLVHKDRYKTKNVKEWRVNYVSNGREITPDNWEGLIKVAIRDLKIPVVHYWYSDNAGREYATVTYMPVFDAVEYIESSQEAFLQAQEHYRKTDEKHFARNALEILRHNDVSHLLTEQVLVKSTDNLINLIQKEAR